jgi:hypothetical protein
LAEPFSSKRGVNAMPRISLLPLAAICLLGALFPAPGPADAQGGIDPADPMVRITAPPSWDLEVAAVLAAVSQDVSRDTGIKESFITYYWQTFDTVVYEGEETSKPLFVDLYVPGFFSDREVAAMLTAVAEALIRHAGAERKWLFIHTHFPLPEQVYIGGGIARWDAYRGKPNRKPRDLSLRAPDRFLFNDAAFVFQSLWRFGVAATGGADLGELLTITSRIEDYDREGWYRSWNSMARRVLALGDGFAAAGHGRSAKEAYLRAANYFRSCEVFLPPDDPRKAVAWRSGRQAFLQAAGLSGGLIEHVRIPYEGTTLPGYLVKADLGGQKRPLLLAQTGLDGTAEDLYFIIGAQAARHGFNCLIYEGPGQGEAIQAGKLPFRSDWEQVVTPVVDFALTLPQTDPDQLAIIGYSMGGYLVPRALAFEKRIRWGIVNGGVFSVYEGTMSKFPPEVGQGVGIPARRDRVNQLAFQEMEKHPELRQFINQMLWTFQAESPFELFGKLKSYTMAGVIGDIQATMLVVNSSQDQVAGSNAQAKRFFQALPARKTYLEFTDAQGAQLHCQLGAPLLSSERILNWLAGQVKE